MKSTKLTRNLIWGTQMDKSELRGCEGISYAHPIHQTPFKETYWETRLYFEMERNFFQFKIKII